jgi:NAD(P)-dependent dehydrogenase (short-subunit alcohol dehydrogenase family)
MSQMRDFTGKVALVTGSSSGIGAAIVKHFAECGGSVVVTGRNQDNVKKVAEECVKLSKQGEKGVLEVVGDVTKDADLDRMIKLTIEKFGKLDILVNNAAAGGLSSSTDENLMETYDKVFNTNLRSVMYLTRLAVPYLEKTKGNIINISSVGGLRPLGPFMVYCMSKSALDMFSKCLALELGPKGIRVNSVNPAAVKTNFGAANGISESDPRMAEFMKNFKPYPLGRIGEPEDIARGVAYLASDDASFVTGITLTLDGGSTYN